MSASLATEPPTTSGVTRRRDPVMGLASLAAVVSAFGVLLVPHATLTDKEPSAGEVTEFFTAHYSTQQAQPLLHAFAGVMLLVFWLRLADLVHDLGSHRSARLVRAAGTAAAAVVVVTMGWVAAVVTRTGEIDGVLQWQLYLLGWDFHFRLVYLLPLVLLPTGAAIRRQGSPVVGWSALVLGGLATVAPLGYLGRDTWFVQYPVFMLLLLWTLAAGIALGLRGIRWDTST